MSNETVGAWRSVGEAESRRVSGDEQIRRGELGAVEGGGSADRRTGALG